ncbi:HEAT repeat domain-containing protein [Vibrio aerogenes]|nr:HEAT repeat domain-containing protein [Vibrio aerogenes]
MNKTEAGETCTGNNCYQPTSEHYSTRLAATDVGQLLNQLENSPDNDFSSDTFQTLSFLIKKDDALALQVENAIRNSHSYDEKWKLLNILANNHSQETIRFATDMLTSQNDSQTQKLGLELVDMMALHHLPATLSQALVEATYHQSDPAFLGQVITLLGHQADSNIQPLVEERLQALLSDTHQQIKAAAIDGLAEISAPYQIQETARSYLTDADEMTRNAAISSLFKLSADEIDSDIIAGLNQMKNDPTTTDSTRRLAAAVLEAM